MGAGPSALLPRQAPRGAPKLGGRSGRGAQLDGEWLLVGGPCLDDPAGPDDGGGADDPGNPENASDVTTLSASCTSWHSEGEGAGQGGPLDESAFSNFSPLLAASQDYACLSGCRFCADAFRSSEVDGCTPADGQECEASDAQSFAARRRAAGEVHRFWRRLENREPALMQEAEAAYGIVMSESVRNAMIAAFRELDVWPPEPQPSGVEDDDCKYEELDAPVPVIAQRAWNDEARRRDAAASAEPGCDPSRRAATASYLIDFVHAVGVELPEAESHMALFAEFTNRLERWQEEEAATHAAGIAGLSVARVEAEAHGGRADFENMDLHNLFDQDLGDSLSKLGDTASSWWRRGWPEVLWTFTGVVLVGAAASAGISLLTRALPEEVQVDDGDSCQALADALVHHDSLTTADHQLGMA